MKNLKRAFIIIIFAILITSSYVSASKLRASRIVSSTSFMLAQNGCSFTLSFLNKCSGTGTIILQKKLGQTNSFYDYDSLDIRYIDIVFFSGTLGMREIPKGTYRMKYILNSDDMTETLFSFEKSL